MVRRRKHSGVCQLHRYHYPPVRATENHHIWPLEYNGPDADWNIIELGPTEHDNIHKYIDAALLGKEVPKLTRAEKRIALQGLDAILNKRAPNQ